MNELNFKDYKGLHKTNEYDKKKAELLAEAVTEKITLEKRLDYLNDLIAENSELKSFLWTTLTGECKPLHKIDDSHLKNIMGHLISRGAKIAPEIKAEAVSRGIPVPSDTDAVLYANRMNRAIEAEIIDRDDIFGLED